MVLYRGECMFAKKVLNAEQAGAIGAIIIDNKKDTRLDFIIIDSLPYWCL